MTQLDRIQKYGDINPRSSNCSTFEPFFPGGEVSKWSPTFGKDHHPYADQEDPDHNSNHPKKSVLTIVKEKANKLRQTFSQKKHSHDHYVSTTPSWGVSLEDNENEEDEEHHLESPKYESELAPDWYKKTTMQHPRAVLSVSENHVLARCVNLGAPQSGNATNGDDQTWSKGVSVENLMHSHEAEEEEKSISQERSHAISPRRRTPVVIGVVEKVKEAVNSLLSNDQSSKYTAPINSASTSVSDIPISTHNAHSAKTSPSHDLPISTNAHEVGEEESYGRILQAN
ncbi:hypothetical protein CIPAW_14G065800 [Carya illinoinensis]|uniref:LTI65/LTI78 N-terminal domain-containing protein n=1 Tax=Carya illinoinensis TaxID=32201 RepID=A0A8T1NJ89_CARIL|nr:hypothetical protein CIPAW_14G065800 [Carya illinoinensis]KAG6678191.1 hypothetical protein I3842_14G068300 [Carya illinoinensis]KAG6678192.1 hypothetical protein I3842_14G068300 [Carya illinoinensis]